MRCVCPSRPRHSCPRDEWDLQGMKFSPWNPYVPVRCPLRSPESWAMWDSPVPRLTLSPEPPCTLVSGAPPPPWLGAAPLSSPALTQGPYKQQVEETDKGVSRQLPYVRFPPPPVFRFPERSTFPPVYVYAGRVHSAAPGPGRQTNLPDPPLPAHPFPPGYRHAHTGASALASHWWLRRCPKTRRPMAEQRGK